MQTSVFLDSDSDSEVTQSCPTLCDLMDSSQPGSSVHGIFQARVLEWVAISFPMQVIFLAFLTHNFLIDTATAAAKSLQSCPTVRPHRWQLTRLCRPWDSPGKNTGVGCHFLLQCMKVKRESEVNQSCPTLHYPMDCRLPGSSVHGIFQARVLEWGAINSHNCPK